MSWIKQNLFTFLGISLPIFISALLIEIVFGNWLTVNEWNSISKINIPRNIKIKYDVSKIYGVDLPFVTYSRDENGLRGSCHNPSDIDILTIGGSTTDQRTITDGRTYQDLLQTLLSEEYKRKICFSNAGLDGHSTFGHLESFRSWFPNIKNLRPKYILYYIGINDAFLRYNPNPDDGKTNPARQKILQKSFFYNLVKNIDKNIFSKNKIVQAGYYSNIPKKVSYQADTLTSGVEMQVAINSQKFSQRLEKILIETHSLGSIPICVSQPHLFTKLIDGKLLGVTGMFKFEGIYYNGLDFNYSITALNKIMKLKCLQYDGFYVDISAVEFSENDFYDGMHLNVYGTEHLANLIFHQFMIQKILE